MKKSGMLGLHTAHIEVCKLVALPPANAAATQCRAQASKRPIDWERLDELERQHQRHMGRFEQLRLSDTAWAFPLQRVPQCAAALLLLTLLGATR